MLCNVCSTIDVFSGNDRSPRPHHVSLNAIYQAAVQGCDLCRAIRDDAESIQAIQRANADPIILDTNSKISYEHRYSSRGRLRSIDFRTRPALHPFDMIFASFEIYVEHGCSSTIACAVAGRPIYATPDSKGCFKLIRSWMKHCQENHEYGACPARVETTLPSRILALGAEGDELFLKVTDRGEMGSYVNLSHCWGPGPHIRMTSSNIDTFKKSIKTEDLPATFRDAITVTRKLGYRFLWIDSLCIMQDSHEDWVKEAALMGHYYKRSALTIAIDSAGADVDGFLHLGRTNDPPLAILHSPGTGCFSSKRPLLDKFLVRRPKLANNSPLSKRCWTLQENILSPRTIHYTTSELVWDCQTTMMSERNPDAKAGIHSHLKEGFLKLSDTRWHAGEGANTNEVFQRWYSLVNDYANRVLTVPSDKFPAISGLAREFHHHTKATYKAGIWLEDIHRGLLWSHFGRGHRPDAYRAPSWSWAALDRRNPDNCPPDYRNLYRWYNMAGHVDEDVLLNAKITPQDNDPYGAVADGELTLRAFWMQWPRDGLQSPDDLWTLPPQLDVDYEGYRLSNTTPRRRVICSLDDISEDALKWQDPESYRDISLLRFSKGIWKHLALLLQPAQSEGTGEKFVKIGIAQFQDPTEEAQLEKLGWVKRDVVLI